MGATVVLAGAERDDIMSSFSAQFVQRLSLAKETCGWPVLMVANGISQSHLLPGDARWDETDFDKCARC